MSNDDDDWRPPNQTHAIPRQLADGVRGLMLDVHDEEGQIALCHEFCALGMISLVDALGQVRAFLDDHPGEVVTIIFESYVPASAVEGAMREAGLLDHAHAQPAGSPWPTLGEMVDAGRRLVVLTDREGGAYPWYHDVWQHAWETDWSADTPADLTCAPNRGDPANPLFILNHFLTDPVALPRLAQQVNVNPFFLERARACQAASGGALPSFPTVDFYDIGDVFAVVDALNAP